MEKVTAVLKKVRDEVPAVSAFVVLVLNVVLTALGTLPEGATAGLAVTTVALALVRFAVSPAYPSDAEEARRLAGRYFRVALEARAKDGDPVAQDVLDSSSD